MSEANMGKGRGRKPWMCGPNGRTPWNKGMVSVFKHKKSSIKKMSTANKGKNNSFYGKTHSKAIIKFLRENSKGNENRAKDFILISPSGEIVKGKNLAKFSRENNLESRNLQSVIKGRRKSHKGWTAAPIPSGK